MKAEKAMAKEITTVRDTAIVGEFFFCLKLLGVSNLETLV